MADSICVDASLILRTLVPAPHSDSAAWLLATWHREHIALVAPALLAFEVTSVLRRLVHLAELTPDEGDSAFSAFRRLDIRLSHRRDMFPLAWRLAQVHDQPRAYDAAYLALAQLHGCAFWTADARLFRAVSAYLPWVHWVGDAPGAEGSGT
jgi:predicted nucleic acid-binding protein